MVGKAYSGNAFDVSIQRVGAHLENDFKYRDREPEFRTELGFDPQPDIRRVSNFFLYKLDQKQSEKINNYFFLFRPQLTWDHNGVKIDKSFEYKLRMVFKGNSYLVFGFLDFFENLKSTDFPGIEGIKKFHFPQMEIMFGRFMEKFSVEGVARLGDQINFAPSFGGSPILGDYQFGSLTLKYTPIPKLTLTNQNFFTSLKEPTENETIFENKISRLKSNWQFNKNFSLRVIMQYESLQANNNHTFLEDTRDLSFDVLFSYVPNPAGGIYLGYNSNWENQEIMGDSSERFLERTKGEFHQNSEQFFLKMSYVY